MLTLLMFFALQVASPAEMVCLDSVSDVPMPSDLYIAGVELEGDKIQASQGELVYLNGPGASLLRVGDVEKVVRPEGKLRDPFTDSELGVYFRDLGTIQIEAVNGESATAVVLVSCREMIKGDLVRPYNPKPAVQFAGSMSNALTPIPEHGLSSFILMGKDNLKELAAGQFCLIGVGSRDGVKPGDRFTVFRPYPAFNPDDMLAADLGRYWSYDSVLDQGAQHKSFSNLNKRVLPPRILGDIVIVEAYDKVSAGRIINGLTEINPGDLVVKR